MKTQVLIASLIMSLFVGFITQAQEKDSAKRDSIVKEKSKRFNSLIQEKDGIKKAAMEKRRLVIIEDKKAHLDAQHKLYVSNQKTELKNYIELINDGFFVFRDLTEEEKEIKKREKAKEIASRINAHRAKTDAEIAYLEVETLKLLQLNETDGTRLLKALDINVVEQRKYQKQIKTTSRIALGFGYNYVKGNILSINDFSYPNNEYFSLGYQFQTAISDDQKWRFNYGIAYQSQGLELNGNRVFQNVNGSTQITEIGFEVSKAKFRQDQLIIPLQLEFGQNSKKEYEDGRVRFTQYGFKYGIGGFVGVNLSSRLKLKYERDGRNVKDIIVNNFDNEVFLYGLDAYVGRGSFTVFGRMNLNNVFKSNSVDAQYVSFGIRIQ